MIVRRITAGAAAVALAGTAFAAAPAMAKSNTTTIAFDAGLVSALGSAGASVEPVKPAKLKGTTLSLPAKKSGKSFTHKGGFSIKSTAATLTLVNFSVNSKNGKVTATATAPLPDPLELPDVLVIKGGKKSAKGWKNGSLKLAKSFTFGGQPTDPATLIGQILGIQLKTGQTIGKINISVK